MGEKKMNIENLFRERLESHRIVPSESLLRRIRFRLWLKDFFSLNLRTFNVGYVLVLFTGISLPFVISQNFEKKKEIKTSSVSNSVGQKNPQQSEIISTESNTENIDKAKSPESGLPAVSFISSVTQGCAPLSITFKNSSKNADKYYWDFGNGNTSAEKNPKAYFEKAGQYTVTLIASNADRMKNTFKQTIVVYASPVADVEINVDESDMKTRKVVFKNKSENADNFIWNFGDNTTSNSKEAIHNYNKNGRYSVTLTASSQYGCTDTTVIENTFVEKDYQISFPPKFRPGTYNAHNNGFYENAADQNFIFYPLNNGAQSYVLRIFAPNGEEVFNTTNIKQGWNGFIKGRVAPPGRYTYVAKGIYPNGQKFEIENDVDVLVDEVNGYY
jgi:PKD repeat protein